MEIKSQSRSNTIKWLHSEIDDDTSSYMNVWLL